MVLLGKNLGQGLFGLLLRGCHAVPADLILHERDALALDGLGNDDRRLALLGLRGIDGIRDGLVVMTVDGHDVPAEGTELVLDGIDGHDVVVVAVNLKVVVIHEGDNVVAPVVAGAHRRRP